MAKWQPIAQQVVKTLGLKLSPEQERVFYSDARLTVMTGGEGAGKSFLGALRAVARGWPTAFELGWIIGADFEDARKEIEYIYKWASELGIVDESKCSMPTTRDQRWVITLDTGLRIETISAYDYMKIAREQPDFIIGCEISRWEREAWDRAYGRLSRKEGAWGFFSGSFESSEDWMAEIYQTGQKDNPLEIESYSVPSWANLSVFPGGFDNPKITQLRLSMSESRFMERHAGRPAPPRDSVFQEFRHTLHVDAQAVYEPGLPVYVFIDPGDLIYACEFVQIKDEEVRVVDEVYVHHWTHEQVVQACTLRPCWKDVKMGVCDIAGYQHHDGMPSVQEAWLKSTGISLKANFSKVDASIERVRSVLSTNPNTGLPRLRINPKAKGLICEMGGGKSPVELPDGKGIGRWRIKGGTPEAKNDHACKALAYGLIELFGTARPTDKDEGYEGMSYLVSTPLSSGSYGGGQSSHRWSCSCPVCKRVEARR